MSTTAKIQSPAAAQAMAQRRARCWAHLSESLRRVVPMDDDTAQRVTDYYFRNKLAKADPYMGTATVAHGCLLDASTVVAAIRLCCPDAPDA
jgi:hypothetical protein